MCTLQRPGPPLTEELSGPEWLFVAAGQGAVAGYWPPLSTFLHLLNCLVPRQHNAAVADSRTTDLD